MDRTRISGNSEEDGRVVQTSRFDEVSQEFLEELAKLRGIAPEDAAIAYKKAIHLASAIPSNPPGWWGPSAEDEKLVAQGLLDPRNFERQTQGDQWEHIPLRDPDGEIIPFFVRRTMAHALPYNCDKEIAQESIAKWIQRWLVSKQKIKDRGDYNEF